MKSIALETTKSGFYTLCAIVSDNDELIQYVVASFYNPKEKFGNQWNNGAYFFTLEGALSLIRRLDNKPTIYRLEEICSHALHWIEDEHQDIIDFINNYDLDMSDDEFLFFGLDKYI